MTYKLSDNSWYTATAAGNTLNNIKPTAFDLAYPSVVTGPVLLKPDLVSTRTAVKADTGKPNLSLLPYDAIEEITKVLDFGAHKYAAHNWKEGGGFSWTRVFSSLMRHLFAWAKGKDTDPESGLSHLAHAGCNVLFLLHYSLHKDKYSKDDRVL